MSNQNIYKPKVWNAICDVCGFKKKSDELRLRWDNMRTCPTCWETRHPQDFLRARKELSNKLPWTRPDATSGTGTSIGGNPIPPNYQLLLYVDDGYVEADEYGLTYFTTSTV